MALILFTYYPHTLQIGMENKSGTDTRLLYCTTGVLLAKLIAAKNMHQYTHVILDEVSIYTSYNTI